MERDIQHGIIKHLRLTGHFVLKTGAGLIHTQDNRLISMGSAGQTDLIVGIKPDWIMGWVEVKEPSGSLSEKQRLVFRDHDTNKRRWLVACDVEDVIEWLKNPSYHGKERFVTQVFTNIKHRPYVPKPYKDPFKGTPYEEMRDYRDKRTAAEEARNGLPPF